MGAEAACTLRQGRKRIAGKALLETSELIFRGDGVRLRIPFKEMTSVEAADDVLRVRYGESSADFLIGAVAARWAEKIRNPKSLLDKLGVKDGQRVVVLGVRDEYFLADLHARVDGVGSRMRSGADMVFVQADTLGALGRLAAIRKSIARDGAIWTITPRGKTGIKDTDVMAAGKAAGLVDVKVAAFSATHSALKFVIPRAQR